MKSMIPENLQGLTSESAKYESITYWLGLVNIGLVGLTLIITVATFYFGDKLSDLKEKIANIKIAESNTKAQNATATAEIAKTESSVARKSATEAANKSLELQIKLADAETVRKQAQKETAEAQLALNRKIEEDRKKAAPRVLTEVQRKGLLAALSKINKPNVIIIVVAQLGDQEAENYGHAVFQILKDAGLPMKSGIDIGPIPYADGVSITIKDKAFVVNHPSNKAFNPVLEEFIHSLQSSLDKVGIHAPLYFDNEFNLNDVYINIGYKPR